ncbi:MAG: hypothetical protein JXB39_05150 [Deltaproteobacteria bacterium]|nr:hypothetical protein [Deltaproteobacteria bacterium]
MTRSSLVNALLLVGDLSTTTVGCGDDSDHDGDVGPDLGPADPIDDVCDVIAGGSRSGQLLEFDLARAYATWRLFSPSGDWLGGDEALARTLEDADDWTDDLAGRIVAELGEGCVVAADDDALNPASVELVGNVALVVPGSGDLMLPAGTSVVAVDLRGLPATDEADAALDVAVALALRQDLALATRVVRTFNGFPSQLYYTMNYYSSAEAYVDVTVAAGG